MASMRKLVEYLAKEWIPLPATSWLEDKYGVLIYFDDRAARNMAKILAPSFFLTMKPEWGMHQQIHVLEGRVATLRNCMLLVFNSFPNGLAIKDATARVRKPLGAVEACSRVKTEPFRLNKASMPFTVGGSLPKAAMDKILTPLVKKALKKSMEDRKRPSETEDEIARVKCAIGGSARGPRTIVVWLRKSEAEKKGKTSIPRQLWSILTSEAPPLMDLRLEDRIVVLVEYCSSAANPLSDRAIKDAASPDRPIDLLTANPDRFTRRPEEVAKAYERTGDEWYTQGLRTTASPVEWIKVREREDVVKEQLRLGRQGADQTSFYARMTAVKNRVNTAVEYKMPSPQLDALRSFLREVIAHHGITTLLYSARESSTSDSEVESRSVAATLSRQDTFLNAILPAEIDRRIISLPTTSAYMTDAMTQQIKSELETIPGKAMLVSTTLDRILRRKTHYDDLCASLVAGGHLAMSFIWDTKTGVIDVPDAVRLRPEA